MRRTHSQKSDLSASAVTLGVRPQNNRHQVTVEVVLASVAAKGTMTLTGVPNVGDTITINDLTWTFRENRTSEFTIAIGATAAATVTNIVNAVNEDYGKNARDRRGHDRDYVTAADGAGDTVEVTWFQLGTVGNSIVFTESAANLSMDGSGTLGGTTAGVGDGSAHVPAAGTLTVSYQPHQAMGTEDSTDTYDLTAAPATKTFTGMFDKMVFTPASLDADCSVRIIYNGWKE